MPNLSIKNVPEEIVAQLKERAKRNHRSLQGELLEAVAALARGEGPTARSNGLDELIEANLRAGLTSASDSVAIIREFRDRHDRR